MKITTHFRRDLKRRQLFQKYEILRKILKTLFRETNLPFNLRFNAFLQLQNLPKDSNPTRIRNRCTQTLRPRAIYSKFGLSRLTFRELAHKGLLPGVTKASW